MPLSGLPSCDLQFDCGNTARPFWGLLPSKTQKPLRSAQQSQGGHDNYTSSPTCAYPHAWSMVLVQFLLLYSVALSRSPPADAPH